MRTELFALFWWPLQIATENFQSNFAAAIWTNPRFKTQERMAVFEGFDQMAQSSIAVSSLAVRITIIVTYRAMFDSSLANF